MCTNQRSLVSPIPGAKTPTPREGLHLWCEIQPCLYSHLGYSRQPILHHIPGSIRYHQLISPLPGGLWGPHPCPGIRTGTCGKRNHSISYSLDHPPVYVTLPLSSLVVTLQHQCRDLHPPQQLCLLHCQHSSRLHQLHHPEYWTHLMQSWTVQLLSSKILLMQMNNNNNSLIIIII